MKCECKHESDIGELKALVPRLEESVKELVVVLRGNNSNGFITKLKVLTTKVNVQWWFIGIIIVLALADRIF